MDISQVEFLSEFPEASHPRFALLDLAEGRQPNFDAYQIAFEHLVAERRLMTGAGVTLENAPLRPDDRETELDQKLGINKHMLIKMDLVPRLLELYDSIEPADFFETAFRDSAYFRYLANARA